MSHNKDKNSGNAVAHQQDSSPNPINDPTATRVCNRIIRIGFYLLFILVPLILTPINYELFEYNKMMVTYALTVIIIGAWTFKMAANRKFEIAKTPLDIPITLFTASQLVSALFSMDPHVSWFGYYSRFNGGMWSVITYVLLYYAFVSNFRNSNGMTNSQSPNSKFEIRNSTESEFIIRLLKVALGTAVAVSLYAVAEHFGIDKHLWVQDVQSRVFSTLGQPNWLSAYLIALLPVAMAFFVKTMEDGRLKVGIEVGRSKVDIPTSIFNFLPLPSIVYLLISCLFFITAIFTRSRAGLLGLAVADVIFWLLVWWKTQPKKNLYRPFAIIHTAFFLIVIINGTYINQIDSYFTVSGLVSHLHTAKTVTATAKPVQNVGTALEYGGTESGTIRKYVWQGAISAWLSSTKTFLIGTGTETFAWAFFRFRPAAHNLVSEWDFLYNKAHNEYLNYLATTGIFGLGSYLLLLILFIVRFVNSEFRIRNSDSNLQSTNTNAENLNSKFKIQNSNLLSVALFAGWVSILITNFFGFSVVIVQLFLFLFVAMMVTSQITVTAALSFRQFPLPKNLREVTKIMVVLLSGYLLVSLGFMWLADVKFASGYHYDHANLPAQGKPYLDQAIALNPGEPLYHDEMASTLATLTVMVANTKDATSAGQLAKESINQSDIALSISPNNVNFWKTRTKVFYTFSQIDPQFNKMAIEALNKASALSPNDPKIYYNLAILYGRENDTAKALAMLDYAKKIKPDYRDAYYALYAFYTDMKKTDLARQSLEEYLTKVDPNDQDFKNRIK
jgi:putative inorganic carbon (HCO3(-)) transporter